MSTPRTFNAKQIAPFKPGAERTVLSASAVNEIVAGLNVWLRAKVVRGETDGAFISDGNLVLQIKRNG